MTPKQRLARLEELNKEHEKLSRESQKTTAAIRAALADGNLDLANDLMKEYLKLSDKAATVMTESQKLVADSLLGE